MAQSRKHRRSPPDEQCVKHQFEAAIDCCRHCGLPFCGECLIYSFGERQPPFCIPCALGRSGVRSTAARVPTVSKKELRKREKEARDVTRPDLAETGSTAVEIDWSLPGENGDAPTTDGTYPTFEDTDEPQRPAPPSPSAPSRLRGRFGRRDKSVPF